MRSDRLTQAIELGPLALLRLKAECLIERTDAGLTSEERDTLERISAAPRPEDEEYLRAIYHRIEPS